MFPILFPSEDNELTDDETDAPASTSSNVGRVFFLIVNKSTDFPARQDEISSNNRRSMLSCLEGIERMIE